MYTILACFLIIFISFVFLALFACKKQNFKRLLCCFVLVLLSEIALFAFWPISSYYHETVNIAALKANNEILDNTNIVIKSFFLNNSKVSFPKIISGKWLWIDGQCSWNSDNNDILSQNIELEIPVGVGRGIVFQGNQNGGQTEISYGDISQTVDLYSKQVKDISISIEDSPSNILLLNEFMRIITFAIIHFAFLCVSFIIIHYYFDIIGEKVKIYKYEIVFFAFSVFMIIRYSAYPQVYGYVSSFYLKGYEFGFVKRGLLGWISTNISPFISLENLANYKLYFLICFYFFISIILGKFVKFQKDDKIRWFLVLLILSLPSTFIYISDDLRFDVYVMAIFLICTICICKDFIICSLPVFCLNMLLFSETTCTYYMLPLLAMLLYKYVKYKDKKFLTVIIGILFFAIPICLLFVFRNDPWLQQDVTKIIKHMQNHAGFNLHTDALSAEVWTLSFQIKWIIRYLTGNYKVVLFFLSSLIPVILLFICFWKTLYCQLKKKYNYLSYAQKLTFFILTLSPLSSFMVMIISFDYGRYFSFMFSASILTIFFLIYEERMQITYKELCFGDIEKNTINIVPILICVFYLLFGTYAPTAGSMPTIKQFYSFISAF